MFVAKLIFKPHRKYGGHFLHKVSLLGIMWKQIYQTNLNETSLEMGQKRRVDSLATQKGLSMHLESE
jgi:hypothetical protein